MTNPNLDDVKALAERRKDTFRGDNANLVASINALLDLDDANALVPHGIGGKGSHAYKLLASAALRLASQQEALTHETAKIAAEAIKDYADNNLSMMEACDMETGKAEQIYRAARLLLEMLDGKFPDASQREDVEADHEIMKDMYCKISNVVGRKGTEKEGLDVQVARLIAQREDVIDREASARIIDPDAFNATTTKHWTSSWIIKRQREARERADAIARSLPSRGSVEDGAERNSIQIESSSDTASVPLSQTLAQADTWYQAAMKAHGSNAFRSLTQAYYTLLNRMSAQKAVIDTEQSGHVPSQVSKEILK